MWNYLFDFLDLEEDSFSVQERASSFSILAISVTFSSASFAGFWRWSYDMYTGRKNLLICFGTITERTSIFLSL